MVPKSFIQDKTSKTNNKGLTLGPLLQQG